MKLTLGLSISMFALLLSTSAFGQTEVQSELLPKHNLEQLVYVYGQTWVNQNEPMVNALIECKSTRITFIESPLTENDKYPLLSSYPLMNKLNPKIQPINFSEFSPETFNPFIYNIEFLSDRTQAIRIDSTNWVMVVEAIKRN